jgi:peptide/nickel transport system substrate-binding protein
MTRGIANNGGEAVGNPDPQKSLVELARSHVSRRDLIKRASVLGLRVPAVAGLLAACGGDDDEPSAADLTQPPAAAGGATPTAMAEEEDDGETPEADATEPVAEETPEAEATEPAAEEQPTDDQPLVIVDGTEPSSLLPPTGTGPFQHPINGMYEGLVELNEVAELEPLLALSWEVSDDGGEWTFNLREGVTFHDGTEFTSEAVKVTIDNILDPDVAASRRSSYTLITNIDHSEPYVARITTDPPNPDLPFLMTDSSAKIISPANLEEHGPQQYGQNYPVGTGPYKFVEWIPNDHISLVRYDDYWGDPPQIVNFIFRAIPEVSTRVVVTRTGEADLTFNLPPTDVEELEGLEGLIVHSTPSLTVHMMEPKVAVGPMSDRRVRHAMNMAIDKDALIQNIMRGYAQPLLTPAIPGLFGTINLDPLPYDPEQAQSLMVEAGYPDGFPLRMVYTSGRWAGDDQVVEAVQGFWANHLGIQMEIERRDQAGFVDALREDPYEHEGLIIMPIRTSYYNDYHLYRMYHTEATHGDTAQRSGYSNPEVDELIEAERQEFDEAAREDLFHQIQRLIWEDQPFIYLFQGANIWSQKDNIEGFEIHPGNSFVPKQVRRT